MTADEVLALFAECGAMLEGHFELSSGLHSDRYFQCALALSDPARAERLARALAEALPAEVRSAARLVVGPALGAVVLAHETARAMALPGLFTERKEGVMSLRRGFHIEPGTPLVVVEDVLTTGRSVNEVLDVLAEKGARPLAVGTLIDRTAGAEPFRERGLAVTSLAQVEVSAWSPDACPLCAPGTPAIKPGSRPAPDSSASDSRTSGSRAPSSRA